MLSSRLLKKREKHNWFYEKTEPVYVWLNEKYSRALEAFMKVRWISFIVIAGMAFGIYALYNTIPTELAPIEDRGEIRINVTGPEGATFEYMERVMDELDRELTEAIPEAERVGLISMTSPSFGSASTNTGNIRLILTEASLRNRSQQEIFEQVSDILKSKTAVRAYSSQAQSIGDRRGGLPVQDVVQAQTREKLKDVIPELMDAVNRSPVLNCSEINLKFTKPAIEVEIDRNKARTIGVSVQEIARTLQLSYSGQRFDFFIMNGKQYQVVGEMQQEDRNKPVDLTSLYVRAENGSLVQLDNLVTIREQSTPPQLYRYTRFISGTVSAGLAKGYTIGAGLNE